MLEVCQVTIIFPMIERVKGKPHRLKPTNFPMLFILILVKGLYFGLFVVLVTKTSFSR